MIPPGRMRSGQLNVTKNNALPVAVKAVAGLLILGTCASGVSFLALLLPQSPLRHVWRLNPEAGPQLLALGPAGVVLMGTVCLACALGSIGLLHRKFWGYGIALGILAVNATVDAVGAFVRDDMRTLIGVPIGIALIVWLLRPRVVAIYQQPGR